LWFEVHQPLVESAEPGIPILQGRAFVEVVQQLRPGVVISREKGMSAKFVALLLESSDEHETYLYKSLPARS
jgi:hypothetical protein